MSDVCFSKAEVVISQPWIKIHCTSTKFGLRVDFDRMKVTSSTTKPEVVWSRCGRHYGRRIANRTQAFERHQLEWPSVTYNPDFKVTIIQRQLTRKWYNIELCLSYNGRPIESRIWCIERRHFQWPWTTPTTAFEVTTFFDAEYLRNGTRYIP